MFFFFIYLLTFLLILYQFYWGPLVAPVNSHFRKNTVLHHIETNLRAVYFEIEGKMDPAELKPEQFCCLCKSVL